jgi:hypothetical protein
MASDVLELINLVRYPIDAPEGQAFADVVLAAREQIAAIGAAELPGFVNEEGRRELVRDAEALTPRAYRSGGIGTAYLELPDEEAFDAEHPRRTWMPYDVAAVAYDLMPETSPLRQIYESEAVRAFLEAILDRGPLYRYADPFGALNLAVMAEGDQLQWHFDQTDFVVSLAIQASERGGTFDVVPRIRSADDEHYDAVASLLAGDEDHVVTLAMTPGTLLVFEGRNSIHRVSPIEGATLRHVGLLAYDTKPGTLSSDLLRAVRYGRTEPFAEPPEVWPVA